MQYPILLSPCGYGGELKRIIPGHRTGWRALSARGWERLAFEAKLAGPDPKRIRAMERWTMVSLVPAGEKLRVNGGQPVSGWRSSMLQTFDIDTAERRIALKTEKVVGNPLATQIPEMNRLVQSLVRPRT